MNYLFVWFALIVGLVSVLAAWFDWDWYMTHRKAIFFVNVFGRKGARIFYAILGVALFALGFVFVTGIVPMSEFNKNISFG